MLKKAVLVGVVCLGILVGFVMLTVKEKLPHISYKPEEVFTTVQGTVPVSPVVPPLAEAVIGGTLTSITFQVDEPAAVKVKTSRWQDQIQGTNETGEPILPEYWFADILTSAFETNVAQMVEMPNWTNCPQLVRDTLLTPDGGSVTNYEGRLIPVNAESKKLLIRNWFTEGWQEWEADNVPPGYHGHYETGVVMNGIHDDTTCPVR